MKNSLPLGLCLASLLCLVNTGFQSTSGDDKPAINFYGVAEVRGKKDRVENILIGGGYEGLKFYLVPENDESDPKAAYRELRLDDIKTIKAAVPLGSKQVDANIKKFKGLEYVEVIIELDSGRTDNYLVERARKLSYDIPFADPSVKPLEQDVRFDALQQLNIEGHRQRPRDNGGQNSIMQKSAAQEVMCTQAKKNIEKLEQESKGAFDQFLGGIKEAVYYLCG